jgi:hypothetical protein
MAKKAARRRKPRFPSFPPIVPLSPEEREAMKSPLEKVIDQFVPLIPQLVSEAIAKVRADVTRPSTSQHVRERVSIALRKRAALDWSMYEVSPAELLLLADILSESEPAPIPSPA